MKMSSAIRAVLLALTAFAGAMPSFASHAESGTVSLTIYKAGWIIGGSGGSGTLTFHGRSYPLSVGGISYGFTFGASETPEHPPIDPHLPSLAIAPPSPPGASAWAPTTPSKSTSSARRPPRR